MKMLQAVVLVGGLTMGAAMVGCTQMPTDKQGISDLRPQISFKATSSELLSARVLIDGLDMGSAEDYLENSAALRILPGNHVLRIIQGNQLILEEKFYLGDGVNRTFVLK